MFAHWPTSADRNKLIVLLVCLTLSLQNPELFIVEIEQLRNFPYNQNAKFENELSSAFKIYPTVIKMTDKSKTSSQKYILRYHTRVLQKTKSQKKMSFEAKKKMQHFLHRSESENEL